MKTKSIEIRKRFLTACCVLAVAGVISGTGCNTRSNDVREEFDIETMNDSDTTRYFETSGIVRAINESGSSVVIRHDAIPNFMSAMTMPFHVADTTIVEGVSKGDSIRFILSVKGTTVFVDSLAVVTE